MVKGIGIDLVSLPEFRRICGDWGAPGQAGADIANAFVSRTFTAAELAQAAGRHDPCEFLAGRFACKEAVFKAGRPDRPAPGEPCGCPRPRPLRGRRHKRPRLHHQRGAVSPSPGAGPVGHRIGPPLRRTPLRVSVFDFGVQKRPSCEPVLRAIADSGPLRPTKAQLANTRYSAESRKWLTRRPVLRKSLKNPHTKGSSVQVTP